MNGLNEAENHEMRIDEESREAIIISEHPCFTFNKLGKTVKIQNGGIWYPDGSKVDLFNELWVAPLIEQIDIDRQKVAKPTVKEETGYDVYKEVQTLIDSNALQTDVKKVEKPVVEDKPKTFTCNICGKEVKVKGRFFHMRGHEKKGLTKMEKKDNGSVQKQS